MLYHEVVGLLLVGIMVIHILFNNRWLSAHIKNLSSLTAKGKFSLLVDTLLIISFIIIGISGVFISKKLFHLQGPRVYKFLHNVFGRLTIVLLGIHFGLHRAFINKLFRWLNVLGKYRDIFVNIILVILSAIGVYSMVILGSSHGPRMATFSWIRLITIAFQYMCIMTLFATITLFITKRYKE